MTEEQVSLANQEKEKIAGFATKAAEIARKIVLIISIGLMGLVIIMAFVRKFGG